MASFSVPAVSSLLLAGCQQQQQQQQPLIVANSISSDAGHHKYQIITLVRAEDCSGGSQSAFTIGPFCQPLNASFSQIQVASVNVPQVALDVSGRQTKTSGKHRKSKKRRRLNKELEMLGRSVIIKERREQFMNETQWVPISEVKSLDYPNRLDSPVPIVDDTSLYIDVITEQTNNTTPTPTAVDNSVCPSSSLSSQVRALLAPTPVRSRPNPLPVFPWADSHEIWDAMMSKEELPGYWRDCRWFSRHPAIQPRLRTVLLDWLMEVCEEYRLRRETYHVAIDFIDRFLSRTNSVSKRQLQLVGIGALFVAAKVEEIHPVKVADISYVTGDVCTERDILQQECAILKELKWDLTPITCVSWVTVFLQTLSASRTSQPDNAQFMTPQYSQYTFVQIMRLLDLCLLDAGSLQFPYSVLAASAMYHTTSIEDALSVSSYQWSDIEACVKWMSTFHDVLREAGATPVKFFDRISPSETHTLQTHVIDSTVLTAVQKRQVGGTTTPSNVMKPRPLKSARLSSAFSTP